MAPQPGHAPALQDVLGYLNFSAGAEDTAFLRNLSDLYRSIEGSGPERDDTAQIVRTRLSETLAELERTVPAFRDAQQARGAIEVAFGRLPAAYREHHKDLLLHQSDAALWRPFFMGRACQAVLEVGGPWDEVDRVTAAAIERLSDYIGYRPVAVLRTAQRLEPYPEEWVRPIPLFIRGAGVAPGRYQALVERALALLADTDPDLLAEAYFDIDLLDELALDPRAYDFEHPVNKRPNYHFGQWDPHHLDREGRFRRFVLQQIPLDGLLDRVQRTTGPKDEIEFEAAAVLAGTILMASGTSGSTPLAHDSTMSLATLLPKIARYRDAFYTQLIEKVPDAHRVRLREEAQLLRQPLAGARQALNQYLSRRRARQLEEVHLALIFARMGYTEAALAKARDVSVPSARMRCEIQCRITAGELALEAGNVPLAAAQLPQIEDFLARAIKIGALVDPWNILGFQGQFSLFPALENSVTDHRVDQLIQLLEQIFGLYLRVSAEAAAHNDAQLEQKVAASMKRLAEWWDQFAATTVESVDAFSGQEAYDSARKVSEALKAWHQAGEAAADIAFWRDHVDNFQSPKSYALVVGVLLDKRDYVAAMALLLQWLSRAETVKLEQSQYSFHSLVRRWLEEVCAQSATAAGAAANGQKGWPLVVRFFDFLEANAENFWEVPSMELESAQHRPLRKATDERDDNSDEVYGAAYENMVYVDSTRDGVEGETLEEGPQTGEFELEPQLRRLRQHLAFLATVAHLWKRAALAGAARYAPPENRELARRWHADADAKSKALLQLLDEVHAYRIPQPTASRESLLEYDRRRSIKDALLEGIMGAAAAMADAETYLRIAGRSAGAADQDASIDQIVQSVLQGDADGVRAVWPDFLASLRGRTLLYVSPGRGGDPRQVVEARHLQRTIRDLLSWLPRLGLIRQTAELIRTARLMEMEHPVGQGAVSEFDQLFLIANQSLVEALEFVSRSWSQGGSSNRRDTEAGNTDADRAQAGGAEADNTEAGDTLLVESLEQLTQSLLVEWLAHSRTLRLSVLEKISEQSSWKSLGTFIETYGHDLFTQRFLNQGNLRAILHQGVGVWLEKMEQDPEMSDLRLLQDLEQKKVDRKEAVRHLTLAIEAIVENYAEYRDYNSTTTQSDQGGLLYTLLDFVKLRLEYDRIAWHLRPVIAAHEILVRRGRAAAAELWCRALADRTREVADALAARYDKLRIQYGMRLPTVADRLNEKFVRPLIIDRIKGLVEAAMQDSRRGQASEVFAQLKQEIEEISQEPTGIGLEVPRWIAVLEDEVEQAHVRTAGRSRRCDAVLIPQRAMSFEEVEEELAALDE